MGRKNWRKAVAGILVGGVLAFVLIGLVEAGRFVNDLRAALPSTSGLSGYRPAQTTRIYSRDGKLIGTLFRENRTWVPLSKMSAYLPAAVIAVEDSRFYEHDGVDPVGIGRAAWANFRGGEVQQGASTITMQLARNLFLKPERTLMRKAKEALLAMEIERHLSKDRILELYLNQVYFGAGAYGVGAASQLYFGKPPSRLTLAEAAMLAGLPQAPESLCPLTDLEAAKKRQAEVLDRMLAVGTITRTQLDRAERQTAKLKVRNAKALGGNSSLLKYPYFTSYVIRELSQRYDDRVLYEGGLNIYTTLDVGSQKRAESTVKGLMASSGSGYNADAAALVAIENKTGFVRAMVGGQGWSPKNQFNRAWQAERQAGSTFKMFVYATALEQGYTPNDLVADTPLSIPIEGSAPWQPQNADGRFMGNLPLWRALMLSRNVVSARLVTQLGPNAVLRTAQNLGVGQDAEPHLSLALGAVEVTPLEMASAASALPNDGVRMRPTVVTLVTDAHGEVLEDNRQPSGQLALSPTTARLMTGMLQRVVESGTATAAALGDRPAAGKTGTTDNFKDAWFVGYTPEWTTAVWVGRDDHKPMWGCYGGTLPAWIWHDFMASSLPPATASSFPTVANQRRLSVRLCAATGLKASARCTRSYLGQVDPAASPLLCKGEGSLPAVARKAEKEKVKVYANRYAAKPETPDTPVPVNTAPVTRTVVDGVPTYSNTGPTESLAAPASEDVVLSDDSREVLESVPPEEPAPPTFEPEPADVTVVTDEPVPVEEPMPIEPGW